MVGIGFALFTGMFWDQTQPLEKHFESIQSPALRKAFLLFELGDVFHSWWFGILVLLLALNLIACSIARLPKIWIDARNPPKKLGKTPFQVTLYRSPIRLPVFNAREETWVEHKTRYVFFEKHKYARCGVYIIHTALLCIMFGSIVATQAGIDGMMLIPEGGFEHLVSAKGPNHILYSHDLGFAISCTDFRLKTYTDGSPMAYESDLAIFDKNNLNTPIVTKTIRVNDPLEYKNYTFYQASYQALEGEKRIHLKIGPHGGNLKHYSVKPGEKIGEIRPTEFYEDYAGLGSAIKIQQGDTHFVVFRKYPEFDSQVRRGNLDIIYQGFDETYATGISVAKVPCLSFVFVGFLMMFIGLYMAFCMNQRRYYAQITPLENGSFECVLGGVCNRYPQAFEQEFKQIVNQYASL